jgi:hypothetical protein
MTDTPTERALAYLRSLATLAERLAKRDIVVRRLDCGWSSFGSWVVEASRGDDEVKRSLAVRRRAFSEPGPEVFRVTWDGREHLVAMASTPTIAISMLNRWRKLDEKSCESHDDALTVAYDWLSDRLGSSPTS